MAGDDGGGSGGGSGGGGGGGVVGTDVIHQGIRGRVIVGGNLLQRGLCPIDHVEEFLFVYLYCTMQSAYWTSKRGCWFWTLLRKPPKAQLAEKSWESLSR